jgi:hypothetical protein
MKTWLLVAWVLVAAVADRAAAQCCGDCDGNGTVTINELITAVNSALGSCAGPTPTAEHTATPTHKPTATPTPKNHCPFTFADSGNLLCTFSGPYNRGCGTDLTSAFSSDGSTLIVTIDTMLQSPPVVQFAAHVDNPTSASLTLWSTDDFQTQHITAGQVQLNENGGQLVIFPNDPPFMILGCNFVQYVGTYTGSSRSRAVVGQTDGAVLFERVRAWYERRRPDLADP